MGDRTDDASASLLASLPCKCAKCAAAPLSIGDPDTIHPSAPARFLAVCGGDVAKAAHVLSVSLAWRLTFGVDTLMYEPSDVSEARARAIQPVFPMGVHSRRSRGGHPIYIMRVGYAVPSAGNEPNVFNGESGVDAWLKYHVHCNETCLAVHDQKLVVWDLANLSRAQMTNTDSLRLLRRLINVDIKNYPLTVHKVLVVNAPRLLYTIWPAVEAMMDEATLSRLQVLGYLSEPQVRAALLAEVADEDLPDFLGGTFDGPLPVGLDVPHDASAAAAESWSEWMGLGSWSADEAPADGEQPSSKDSAQESGTWREYFLG